MTHSHNLQDMDFLIVEDDYLTETMLAMVLEDAGHKVIGPVSNAETANELLNAKRLPFIRRSSISISMERWTFQSQITWCRLAFRSSSQPGMMEGSYLRALLPLCALKSPMTIARLSIFFRNSDARLPKSVELRRGTGAFEELSPSSTRKTNPCC